MNCKNTFSIPAELVEDIAASRCVLFVGSGLSKHAKNFPTWDELVDRMRNMLPWDVKERTPEKSAREFKLEFLEFMQENHPLIFERSLKDILKIQSGISSRPHELIVGRSRYRGEMLPINLFQSHNSPQPRKGFCTLA